MQYMNKEIYLQIKFRKRAMRLCTLCTYTRSKMQFLK